MHAVITRGLVCFAIGVVGGVPAPSVEAGTLSPSTTSKPTPASDPTRHWAFQPVRKVELPTVKNKAWPRTPIDRFILARLEEKHLSPAHPADRRTLLRRLSFDLTGLPPSQAELESFQQDDSPAAVERVVDRLLASRQFGERWGRHWLDVARYADSNGSDENFTYYDAWRFRNYVIDAFARDKPFDQFVREQLAGDLLPASNQAQRDEQIIGTGFLVLGPKVIGDDDKEQLRMDVVDEQIDTVGKAFLGLSLGCARCHDHKFDPIPTKDYYALAGIFGSTETVHGQLLHRRDLSGWNLRALGPEGEKLYQDWTAYDERLDALKKKRDERQQELTALKKKLESATNDVSVVAGKTSGTGSAAAAPEQAGTQEQVSKLEETLKSLTGELKALGEKSPRKPPLAMAVSERDVIGDTAIRVRGELHRLGATVPRGFVQVLDHGAHAELPLQQSGRLELVQWLVDPANPLTARVAVNRIWHHLFGVGLVRTVDDFGRQGELPSHPELLDYLAARLPAVDWSFKRLIREVVLSRVYQLSSDHRAEPFRVDPENRLLWRMNRRRLDVEALRDGLLAVSGQLDPSPAQATAAHLPDQATGVGDKPHKPFESVRRSVYLPIIRNDLRPEFRIFDFADPQTVTGRRSETIVAPQSLYLLNSELLRDSSRRLAENLLQASASTGEKELVRMAYQQIFSRAPSASELRYSREWLTDWSRDDSHRSGPTTTPASSPLSAERTSLAALCQALLCSSQFLYLD